MGSGHKTTFNMDLNGDRIVLEARGSSASLLVCLTYSIFAGGFNGSVPGQAGCGQNTNV